MGSDTAAARVVAIPELLLEHILLELELRTTGDFKIIPVTSAVQLCRLGKSQPRLPLYHHRLEEVTRVKTVP